MNKSPIDLASAKQPEKTNQQHALEVFGTDWHENIGLQPVLSDVVVDVLLMDEFRDCGIIAGAFYWDLTGCSADIKKWRVHSDEKELERPVVKVGAEKKPNKYQREINPGVFVDVYDVLKAWHVENPALQHLIKKALQPGKRGHKDLQEDMSDIVASALRAQELEK